MSQCRSRVLAVVSFAILVPAFNVVPGSAEVLDTPSFTLGVSGTNKQAVTIHAGATGTPAGFTILWIREEDFTDNDSNWYPPGDPRQVQIHFWGTPTLNVFPGESPTFLLAPFARITVELGDVADESGVAASSTDEMERATSYICRVFANAGGGYQQSGARDFEATTMLGTNCIHTQGYWKNHEDDWPVAVLALGSVVYDQGQLLSILNQPVAGNGLISLAHQLVAAKLNIAGGGDSEAVIGAVLAADDLIGDLVVPPVGSGYLLPSATSELTQDLDDWNNQITGSGSCNTELCCRPDDWTCFPTDLGRCGEIGGLVIEPGECDIFYECSMPSPVEGISWGRLKAIRR
jgi:hypothetical protein